MKLMLMSAGGKEKEPGLRSPYQPKVSPFGTIFRYHLLAVQAQCFLKATLNAPIKPTCEVSQKTHFFGQNLTKKDSDPPNQIISNLYLRLYFVFRQHSFFVCRNSRN